MKKEIPKGDNLVLCQQWEEFDERGPHWGDFSLHISKESLEATIKRARSVGSKDYRSYPFDHHYGVDVADEVVEQLVQHHGFWFYDKCDYECPPRGIVE